MIKHAIASMVLVAALVACTPPAPEVNLEGPVETPPPAELVDTPPDTAVKAP